ncbi:hypothetical protein [Leptolyngbya sp. FACHB-261]|uniref:hypothetical protein n=1 Tax=Leptolyngbya sp. FACHB-261 TaxID=2692806 RepID=UPI0016850BCF|nr:hypothetical protein [Leptolyngbya sp. FACHB-261]MBD2104115.1 hypothetical protein [Leptolyngbya sp. FACHB-261]
MNDPADALDSFAREVAGALNIPLRTAHIETLDLIKDYYSLDFDDDYPELAEDEEDDDDGLVEDEDDDEELTEEEQAEREERRQTREHNRAEREYLLPQWQEEKLKEYRDSLFDEEFQPDYLLSLASRLNDWSSVHVGPSEPDLTLRDQFTNLLMPRLDQETELLESLVWTKAEIQGQLPWRGYALTDANVEAVAHHLQLQMGPPEDYVRVMGNLAAKYANLDPALPETFALSSLISLEIKDFEEGECLVMVLLNDIVVLSTDSLKQEFNRYECSGDDDLAEAVDNLARYLARALGVQLHEVATEREYLQDLLRDQFLVAEPVECDEYNDDDNYDLESLSDYINDLPDWPLELRYWAEAPGTLSLLFQALNKTEEIVAALFWVRSEWEQRLAWQGYSVTPENMSRFAVRLRSTLGQPALHPTVLLAAVEGAENAGQLELDRTPIQGNLFVPFA